MTELVNNLNDHSTTEEIELTYVSILVHLLGNV